MRRKQRFKKGSQGWLKSTLRSKVKSYHKKSTVPSPSWQVDVEANSSPSAVINASSPNKSTQMTHNSSIDHHYKSSVEGSTPQSMRSYPLCTMMSSHPIENSFYSLEQMMHEQADIPSPDVCSLFM